MVQRKMPAMVEEILGKTYSKLTVTKYLGAEYLSGRWRYFVQCACACGRSLPVRYDYVKKGSKHHCGCVKPNLENCKPLFFGKHHE